MNIDSGVGCDIPYSAILLRYNNRTKWSHAWRWFGFIQLLINVQISRTLQYKGSLFERPVKSVKKWFSDLNILRKKTLFKNWILILVLLCEKERQRWDVSRYIKSYNYRHCDTSMSPKTRGVIATLLGNCKVLCYANMNVTLFRVSANQISVFSIKQQSL